MERARRVTRTNPDSFLLREHDYGMSFLNAPFTAAFIFGSM